MIRLRRRSPGLAAGLGPILLAAGCIALPMKMEEVHDGDIVRLSFHHHPQMIGSLANASHDSILIDRRGLLQTVPVDAITRIDRKVGVRRHLAEGIILGAMSASLIGYGVYEMSKTDGTSCYSEGGLFDGPAGPTVCRATHVENHKERAWYAASGVFAVGAVVGFTHKGVIWRPAVMPGAH